MAPNRIPPKEDPPAPSTVEEEEDDSTTESEVDEEGASLPSAPPRSNARLNKPAIPELDDSDSESESESEGDFDLLSGPPPPPKTDAVHVATLKQFIQQNQLMIDLANSMLADMDED